MPILAGDLARYGSTDWGDVAKQRGERYPENRNSWPPLHMQLSATVSKARLDLKTAVRALKPEA